MIPPGTTRSCQGWRRLLHERASFLPLLLLISFGVDLFAVGAAKAATTTAAFAPPHMSFWRTGSRAGVCYGTVGAEGTSPDPTEASPRSPFASSNEKATLPPGFNPFQQYQRSTPGASNPTSATSTMSTTPRTFSLREAQMQELTRALLDLAPASFDDTDGKAVDGTSSTSRRTLLPVGVEQVLQENREWLLAPLEDSDNDKDDDDPASARARRYRAYRATLQDRISQARTPQARWVLGILRDYVVSQE